MAACHYDALALPRAASVEDIKKAYKKAAFAHHPDKGGDPEEFKKVSAAAETLTDATKRREYDLKLAQFCSSDGLGFSSVHSAGLATSTGNSYQADLSGWFAATPPSPPKRHADVEAKPSAMESTPPRKVRASVSSDSPAKAKPRASMKSLNKACYAWHRNAKDNIADEKHALPLKRTALDSMPVRNVRARIGSSTRTKVSRGANEAAGANQAEPQGLDFVSDRRPTARRMGASHLRESADAKKKERLAAEVAQQEAAKSAAAKRIAESKLGSVMDRIRARVQKPTEA